MANVVTVVLSGPKAYRTQAAKALEKAGVPAGVHDHRLPDTAEGGVDPTVSFLACRTDKPAKAAGAVDSLGWVLRAVESDSVQVAPLIDEQAKATEEMVRRIVREEMGRS